MPKFIAAHKPRGGRRSVALATAAVVLAVLGAINFTGADPAASTGIATDTPTPTATPTPVPQWKYQIDCDPETPGVQSACTVPAGRISIDVILTNEAAPVARLGGWQWEVHTDNRWLSPVAVICDRTVGHDCNPEFDSAANTGSWSCAGPGPFHDLNRANDPPALARSFIACANTVGTGQEVASGTSLRLGSVAYDATLGTVGLTLEGGSLYGSGFYELGSCPRIVREMECSGATITVIEAPNSTSTPCSDSDCDGIPDGVDNCPDTPNSSQVNTDHNRMGILAPSSPSSLVNDYTRPLSDVLGDACDDDDDNDGLADAVDKVGVDCQGVNLGTDPGYMDSDGDRFLDGIECILGSSPSLHTDKPALALCGPANDADGDRLAGFIEVCFYGTNPENPDSDGDGTRDGCEAASMNEDAIVNMADIGIIASHFGERKYPANLDVNKDGIVNIGDRGLASSLILSGQCS